MSIKISRSLNIPKLVEEIEDDFSKELIKLWKDRKMQGFVWVAWKVCVPVGYILLEGQGADCTIRGFFVDSRYRGEGIGTQLLHRVMEDIKAEDRVSVIVNITEGAEKFYEREGFTVLGRRKDFPDQKIAFWGHLLDSKERELERKLL